ncbi:MAG: ABC transporter permease, partial [Phycisphaerae bacterium]|nr:ABC transporter permease [Phycisphaerae bacterium]
MPETLSSTVRMPEAGLSPQTFWSRVRSRVFRPWMVKFCAGYIVLVCLIAIFVPFLATGTPYTCIIPAHHGMPLRRQYPLFRDLTTVSWVLLVVAAALAAQAGMVFLTRRLPPDLRRHRRRVWLAMMTAATVIATVLIVTLHHNQLDATDYRTMAAQGQITHAIFAPIPWGYASMEPLSKNLINKLPSQRHWLGTDGEGRDVLSRLLWSTRVAMGIGFISQFIALALGVLVGAMTGYFSGIVDILLMRLVEIVESVPTFFLILTFVAIYGRHIFYIMVILGVTGWTGYARLLRAEFLHLRQLDYVTAAEAAGLPLWRVLFRHILPNGITPVLVAAGFGLA